MILCDLIPWYSSAVKACWSASKYLVLSVTLSHGPHISLYDGVWGTHEAGLTEWERSHRDMTPARSMHDVQSPPARAHKFRIGTHGAQQLL